MSKSEVFQKTKITKLLQLTTIFKGFPLFYPITKAQKMYVKLKLTNQDFGNSNFPQFLKIHLAKSAENSNRLNIAC